MISNVSINSAICFFLFFVLILLCAYPFWKRFKQEMLNVNLGIWFSFICYIVSIGFVIFRVLKLLFPFG